MNQAFTIHWAKVRKAILTPLIISLESEETPEKALASFKSDPLDTVCYSLRALHYLESSGDVWELMEIATPKLIQVASERQALQAEPNTRLESGVFYNQLKTVLNNAQAQFLFNAGCTRQYVLNLSNWYRIYPLVKALNQEWEGRNISPTDDVYIQALRKKIKQEKVKCARRASRLLDIILDFYYEPAVALDFELPSLDLELSEVMGYSQQLMRLNLCFSKLGDYNAEMYAIVKMSVIEEKQDKQIYDELAMSNTKFRSRKTKGLQLLEKCLEEQSLDVLSSLKGEA